MRSGFDRSLSRHGVWRRPALAAILGDGLARKDHGIRRERRGFERILGRRPGGLHRRGLRLGSFGLARLVLGDGFSRQHNGRVLHWRSICPLDSRLLSVLNDRRTLAGLIRGTLPLLVPAALFAGIVVEAATTAPAAAPSPPFPCTFAFLLLALRALTRIYAFNLVVGA